MKNKKENSIRWLRQAEFDLREAGRCLMDESYAYCCFFSEQCSQKSLKSFLIYNGKRFINIHSISKLAEESVKFDREFLELINKGKILDRYYLTTRYPDTVAEPSIPFEIYTEKEAKESLEIATTIFEISKQKLEQLSETKL